MNKKNTNAIWKNRKVVCITTVIIGITIFSQFNCITPKISEIDQETILDSEIGPLSVSPVVSSTEIVLDKIFCFTPSNRSLDLPICLTKNLVYQFIFETYTPYDSRFDLDIYLTCPTGEYYYMLTDRTEVIELNISYVFFDYGVADTGEHNFLLESQTEENINVHTKILSNQTISEYYQDSNNGNAEGNYGEFDPNTLDFYSIDYYSNTNTQKTFNFPMIEGREYWVNLFRTSSIPKSEVIRTSFSNPLTTLTITLGGVTFEYYPDDRDIQTRPYSLESNFGGEGTGIMTSFDTTLRFGAHTTGEATINLEIECDTSLSLNFAFLCYASNQVSSNTNPEVPGEDDDKVEEITDTIEEKYNSTIEKIYYSTKKFFEENIDIILYCCFAAISIIYLRIYSGQISFGKKSAKNNITERDITERSYKIKFKKQNKEKGY